MTLTQRLELEKEIETTIQTIKDKWLEIFNVEENKEFKTLLFKNEIDETYCSDIYDEPTYPTHTLREYLEELVEQLDIVGFFQTIEMDVLEEANDYNEDWIKANSNYINELIVEKLTPLLIKYYKGE